MVSCHTGLVDWGRRRKGEIRKNSWRREEKRREGKGRVGGKSEMGIEKGESGRGGETTEASKEKISCMQTVFHFHKNLICE